MHSGAKGGTWEGAIQNQKKAWVPTWVKQTQDPNAGNAAIVAEGVNWCSENIEELDVQSLLINGSGLGSGNQSDLFTQSQSDLFSQPSNIYKTDETAAGDLTIGSELAIKEAAPESENKVTSLKEQPEMVSKDSFYQLFVQYLQTVASDNPISEQELVEASDLHSKQVRNWLTLAVEQDVVVKLSEPVRYQCKLVPHKR